MFVIEPNISHLPLRPEDMTFPLKGGFGWKSLKILALFHFKWGLNGKVSVGGMEETYAP